MARISRADVFRPDEVAIVHVMNRTVRRCFLMGNDPLTGKNYDHRKAWMEKELEHLAACFGIDLLTYAILSNHFHLILRSRPDVVETWSDKDVAIRWLMLCPLRKDDQGGGKEPSEFEINTIVNNSDRLAEIRSRLSDISWWMRLLSQTIAQRANRDDNEVGKFWQSRFKAVRLLDEAALLACSAYVDLNPIRAAIAETLEGSDYTSVQRRVLTLQGKAASDSKLKQTPVSTSQSDSASKPTGNTRSKRIAKNDSLLAPLSIDELRDSIGPVPSKSPSRASDKGYLPMPLASYLELLDFTARQVRGDKRGSTPESADTIFERLGISGEVWLELVTNFEDLFYTVAGKPDEVDARRTREGTHRHKATNRAREMLTP